MLKLPFHDLWANLEISRHKYGLDIMNDLPNEMLSAMAHKEFDALDITAI